MTTEAKSTDSTKATKSVPKWESDAKERIRSGLRTMAKPLAGLIERDANEGDTRHLVTDFLCDVLGYDKYEDLTTEYQVKGEFADYGVRIDKQLSAFIEVKRVATKLGPKHLRQVEVYAINEGVEWGILTNGNDWHVYHLAPAAPRAAGAPSSGPLIDVDLTLQVSLIGTDTPTQRVNKLFNLSREAMKRHVMDDVWKAQRATSPKALSAVLTSDSVIDAVRKEIKRRTGHNATAVDIAETIRNQVIRPDLS
ncbi:MAG: type I restriction enzyme HsdR N-terminal domain-containing protein [Dehalococcoidia bacterium]